MSKNVKLQDKDIPARKAKGVKGGEVPMDQVSMNYKQS